VPQVLQRSGITAGNSVALVIGPPVMIRNTLPVLAEMGLGDESIFTSLENRMKCGVGKCGRCNCGTLLCVQRGTRDQHATTQQAAAGFLNDFS